MTSRTATCSCGQLRLSTDAEPIRVSVCHCLACQRRTGSAFGVQARFAPDAVTVTGESSRWVRVGDEGGQATFHFCPICGATVYYTFGSADEPGLAVPTGAFAEPGFPSPTVSVYEERMHGWLAFTAQMEHRS